MTMDSIVHLCWSTPVSCGGDEEGQFATEGEADFVIEARAKLVIELPGHHIEFEPLRWRADSGRPGEPWHTFGDGGDLDLSSDIIADQLCDDADISRYLEPGWNVGWRMRERSDVEGEFEHAFVQWTRKHLPDDPTPEWYQQTPVPQDEPKQDPRTRAQVSVAEFADGYQVLSGARDVGPILMDARNDHVMEADGDGVVVYETESADSCVPNAAFDAFITARRQWLTFKAKQTHGNPTGAYSEGIPAVDPKEGK